MKDGQRARNPQQKEARRAAILDASWTLYQTERFIDISMADVAQASNLAKGTLYLYFKTKEELFLTLLTERIDALFAFLSQEVSKLPDGSPLTRLSEGVLQTGLEMPHLLRLLTISSLLLERNTDEHGILRFKETMLHHVGTLGQQLEEKFPILEAGEGAQLIKSIDAIMIGVFQASNTHPNVKATFEAHPHLQVLKNNLETFLSHMIETHLHGIIHQKNGRDLQD